MDRSIKLLKERRRGKRRREELRARIISKYGGKCSCCSIKEPEFLSFDHKYGGGRKQRKVMTGYSFYLYLDKKPRLFEIELLCHNCNFAWGLYGYCPHNRRDCSNAK